ncbi:MAG TPA: hypothetical protein VKG63_03010 [Steroidobacteraceae bacterium]|nr:hypothetical protein [Steroidobacteraceae bacterium]
MLKTIASLTLMLALGLGMSSTALADGKQYLRVIVVKTEDASAYLRELEKGRAMLKRLGVSVQLRAWRATFAGPETGAFIVSQEYPSFAAFAAASAKTAADPEFSEWIKGLDKVRKIVSDSLYQEI